MIRFTGFSIGKPIVARASTSKLKLVPRAIQSWRRRIETESPRSALRRSAGEGFRTGNRNSAKRRHMTRRRRRWRTLTPRWLPRLRRCDKPKPQSRPPGRETRKRKRFWRKPSWFCRKRSARARTRFWRPRNRCWRLQKRDDAVAHGALDVRKADATGSVNAFFALDDGANSQNFATNGANRGGYSMDDPLWRNTAKKHLEYFISMKPVWMATVTGVLFGLFLIAIQVACNLASKKAGGRAARTKAR